RQRVALARALVRRRPLLLLDEPFAALGPALRREMLTLVARLQAEQGLTVVLVSHHPDDARWLAQQVAFVWNGKILLAGPVSTVFDQPGPPELRDYLGAQ
ncbi:MAG: thiamine ABC transporter ATP-binding protein, partial [Candidatus Competibacteraceae bacterium]|nr:thiamine ABC transporter ATP-binding protein [Candidatus Competibacteraceae bacterium]